MPRKSGQSQNVKEPGSKLSLDGKRFFPIGLNLEGQRVLIVGDGEELISLIRGLIECGASLELLAEKPSDNLKDLALTYSHKMKLSMGTHKDLLEGKLDLSDFFLVFAFTKSYADNEQIARLAKLAGVLCTEASVKQNSDFVMPSWFRRGHIKISVATDGISGALEKALINRIKAAFVREMDHYALFADFVIEKVNLARVEIDDASLGEIVNQLIYSEDVCLALQRNNFDEASQLFEHNLTAAIKSKSGNPE
jgi:siroheme synthase-like protein